MAAGNRLIWTLDPETFALFGNYRDKDGGKYQFKIVDTEDGHRVTVGAQTNQGSMNLDLGYIQGSDAEEKGRNLSEFILGTILREGVRKFVGHEHLLLAIRETPPLRVTRFSMKDDSVSHGTVTEKGMVWDED